RRRQLRDGQRYPRAAVAVAQQRLPGVDHRTLTGPGARRRFLSHGERRCSALEDIDVHEYVEVTVPGSRDEQPGGPWAASPSSTTQACPHRSRPSPRALGPHGAGMALSARNPMYSLPTLRRRVLLYPLAVAAAVLLLVATMLAKAADAH